MSWDKLAWFRRRHGDGCRFRCREPALLLRSFAVHHPAHVFGNQIGVPLEHFFSCVHLIARHRGPLTPESAHQPCAALVHIKLVHRHEGECTRVRPSRLGNMTGQVTVAAEQFNRLVEVVAVGNPFNGAFGGSCSSTPRSCESQSCVLSETRGGGGGGLSFQMPILSGSLRPGHARRVRCSDCEFSAWHRVRDRRSEH